jgi:hypothetical protein
MPKTILLLLSMVVSRQWDRRLLDIENAFLHGEGIMPERKIILDLFANSVKFIISLMLC